MATGPRKIEVCYEGMGTCMEATIKLGGTAVAVIYAPTTQGNKIVDELVLLAKNHLVKKERDRCQQKVK